MCCVQFFFCPSSAAPRDILVIVRVLISGCVGMYHRDMCYDTGGDSPPRLHPLAQGARFAAHLSAVNKFTVLRGNYAQTSHIKPNGCGP